MVVRVLGVLGLNDFGVEGFRGIGFKAWGSGFRGKGVGRWCLEFGVQGSGV
jgi:hypothetical protein